MINVIRNKCFIILMLIMSFSSLWGYARYAIEKTGDSIMNQLDVPRNRVIKRVAIAPRPNDINEYIESFIDSLDVDSNRNEQQYDLIEKKAHKEEKSHVYFPIQQVREPVSYVKDDLNKRIAQSRWHDMVEHDFENFLNRFVNNRDFGQIALQQVIDLLEAELNVVRHLMIGHTGAAVQSAVDERNILLKRTIPAVLALYDSVISLATYDSKHSAIFYRHTLEGKKLPKALTLYDQKTFLSAVQNKIEQYRDIMRAMQYDIQQSSLSDNKEKNLINEKKSIESLEEGT